MSKEIKIKISDGEYEMGKLAKQNYYQIKNRIDREVPFEEWLTDILIGAIKAYAK